MSFAGIVALVTVSIWLGYAWGWWSRGVQDEEKHERFLRNETRARGEKRDPD